MTLLRCVGGAALGLVLLAAPAAAQTPIVEDPPPVETPGPDPTAAQSVGPVLGPEATATPAPTPTPAPAPGVDPDTAVPVPPADDSEDEGGILDDIGGAVSDVFTFDPFSGMRNSIAQWAAETAVWMLLEVFAVLRGLTTPHIDAPWFSALMDDLRPFVAVLAVVIGIVAAVKSAARFGGFTSAFRSVPRLFALVWIVAVSAPLVWALIQADLMIQDYLLADIDDDAVDMFTGLAEAMVQSDAGAALGAAVIGAALMILSAVFVLIELLFRDGMIAFLLILLPFAAMAAIDGGGEKGLRMIVSWLVALIFMPSAITLMLLIGISPFAAVGGAGASDLIAGGAIMCLAVFAPASLFKVVDFGQERLATASANNAVPTPLQQPVQHPVRTYQHQVDRRVMRAGRSPQQFSPHAPRHQVAGASAAAHPAAAAGVTTAKAGTAMAKVPVRKASEATRTTPGAKPPNTPPKPQSGVTRAVPIPRKVDE